MDMQVAITISAISAFIAAMIFFLTLFGISLPGKLSKFNTHLAITFLVIPFVLSFIV